ncbi:hypothetical protein RF11_03749 [Thelohanellus kitauei]|uniref:Uncharacterized protein n=1 Tax=Thelohanellus kitauei TaxID=669202 RepID=A0A0C2JS20_THEKT|nr:hypothetical protein RF11_03749 [Thelohanellus kitauei]
MPQPGPANMALESTGQARASGSAAFFSINEMDFVLHEQTLASKTPIELQVVELLKAVDELINKEKIMVSAGNAVDHTTRRNAGGPQHAEYATEEVIQVASI